MAEQQRDTAAMIRAILDLETAIREWSSDTEEDDGTAESAEVLHSLIVRLGDLAARGLRDPRDVFAPIVEPLALRTSLRQERAYALADLIRSALNSGGVVVEDTRTETRWTLAFAHHGSPWPSSGRSHPTPGPFSSGWGSGSPVGPAASLRAADATIAGKLLVFHLRRVRRTSPRPSTPDAYRGGRLGVTMTSSGPHQGEERFHTTTAPNSVTPSQIGTALFLAVTSVVVLVNAVWLPFASDRGERALFVIVGGFWAVVSALFLRWLRRVERYELTVDADGISVTGGRTSRSWRWDEVRALAVVSGGHSRMLTIEDDRAHTADHLAPRSAGLFRALTRLSPLAVNVPLENLTADEHEILDAIRRFSQGRFPGPERRGLRLPGRALPPLDGKEAGSDDSGGHRAGRPHDHPRRGRHDLSTGLRG